MSSSSPHWSLVQLIQDGEPVSAGTTNRPLRQLYQGLEWLWDSLRASQLGQALVLRRVPLASTVQVGMAVYYHSASQQFAPALAQLASGPQMQPHGSSEVWGVVTHKYHANQGDLLVAGLANWPAASVSHPAGTPAGCYYLSSTTPGFLTHQRPPLAIPVLRYDGAGAALVYPQPVLSIEQHRHEQIALLCRPAGDYVTPATGNPHTIPNPNPSLPGWLPASHSIFAGKAPAGAKFGYNLSADPFLQAVWPLPSLHAVQLEWQRDDTSSVGGTMVPLGTNGWCVIDQHGIWWLTDCYNQVPWPLVDPSTVTSTPACPKLPEMRLTLWLTRSNWSQASTLVRSLRSVTPQLRVECLDGSPGTAGDLQLRWQWDWETLFPQDGFEVIKSIDWAGRKIHRGRVLEGVYTTSSNIVLTSSHSETRTIAAQPRTVHQGLVGISVQPWLAQEIPAQLVRLDGVEEQFYQDLMYLGLPAHRASGIRSKLRIPLDNLPASPQGKLQLRLLGRVAGTLPDLVCTIRRLVRNSAVLTDLQALPGPASEVSVALTTSATLTAANQYVLAESAAFPLAPGDLLFVSLRRNAPDSYPGEVGILEHSLVISS
jgi:hypothetical protein